MADKTAQQAYDEIAAYINDKSGKYSQWYCGITADWEERLFEGHQIPDKSYNWWTARKCVSHIAARKAEDALHKLGCDGAPGGGDEDAVWVYVYLKGTMTSE